MHIDFAAVPSLLSDLSSYLHGKEPAFIKELTPPLRVLVLYTIARVGWIILLIGPVLVGILLIEPPLALLRKIAPWATQNHLQLFARMYVRVELLSTALGLPPTGVSQNEAAAKSGRYRPPARGAMAGRPQSLGTARYWIRFFVQVPVVTAIHGTTFLGALIRFFAPRRIANVAAWLAVLAYLRWLPRIPILFKEIRQHLPDISLGAVVAATTIMVLIYVGVGSDIRGRAELNKNASFECRKTLHTCQSMMTEAADLLAYLRRCSAESFRYFPSNPTLKTLTGRADLVWRGSGITHLGASGEQLRTWWPSHIHMHAYIPMISPFGPTRPIEKDLQYTARTADARRELDRLDAIAESFEKALSELDRNGFAFKLNDVLFYRHRRLLNYLRRYQLASITARNSFLGDDDLCFPTSQPPEVLTPEYWSDLSAAPTSDLDLLDACESLSMQLQDTVQQARLRHWQLAVAEQYLTTLSLIVQKTLRPATAERIRQAIGK
jgi:hypothetical protein